MILFNGKEFAQEKEQTLSKKIQTLKELKNKAPKIGCVLFLEDAGGVIYTQEKQTVAKRVGIEYTVTHHSIHSPIEEILKTIHTYNEDSSVTGIIIQKPWKKTWQENQTTAQQSFSHWWHTITDAILVTKDVDGLNRETSESIRRGTWKQEHKVLPATCRSVLSILHKAEQDLQTILKHEKTLILGRSELLGQPLFFELQNRGWDNTTLAGKQEYQALLENNTLQEYTVIISSTGVKNIISGDKLSNNCVVIDAGFPYADVDFNSTKEKAAFLTPVPNGVGPVTVISLLENAVDLCYNV